MGDVLIYQGFGCSGFPLYDKEFSSDGIITWIPGTEGKFSFKVICAEDGVEEGITLSTIGFGMGNYLKEATSVLDIVYNIEIDRWNGQGHFRLNLLDFVPVN